MGACAEYSGGGMPEIPAGGARETMGGADGRTDIGGGPRSSGLAAVSDSTFTDLSFPVTALSYDGGRLGSLGRRLSLGLMTTVRVICLAGRPG